MSHRGSSRAAGAQLGRAKLIVEERPSEDQKEVDCHRLESFLTGLLRVGVDVIRRVRYGVKSPTKGLVTEVPLRTHFRTALYIREMTNRDKRLFLVQKRDVPSA